MDMQKIKTDLIFGYIDYELDGVSRRGPALFCEKKIDEDAYNRFRNKGYSDWEISKGILETIVHDGEEFIKKIEHERVIERIDELDVDELLEMLCPEDVTLKDFVIDAFREQLEKKVLETTRIENAQRRNQ